MDGHTALSDDQRFAAIGGSHDVGDGVTALPWDSGSPSALASTLVEWVRQSSISGTAGERRFGERLLETVRSLPYFRCHRDQVHALRAEGNWQPPVIVAWVKGRAGTPRGHRRPVVVLAGHYDTVGVQDFLARGLDPFDAEAIAIYFRTGQVGREHSRAAAPHRGDHNGAPATGHEGLVEVPMVVHAAACSGQYVFGRGALDMKAGLVASLAALERLSARASELPGDVVWIATPDEENLSRGAIAAAAWLDRWLEEQEATCVALINADYVTGDPAAAPAYFGALGKLLPSFVVIGLPTHVGDPLAGLDPITVAAEIVREVSLHPAFQEDLSMPPPVPLQLRDLKEAYNVQTAPTAAGYFNLYFSRRPAREIMDRLLEATERAVRHMARRYQQHGRILPELPVLTLSQVGGTTGDVYEPEHPAQDPREQARERVLRRVDRAGGPRPSVVWYVGPGCWAPVPDPDELDGGRLRRAVFAAAAELGYDLQDGGPYPFISDMSVLGGRVDPADYRFLRSQSPGAVVAVDTLPPEGRPALPCVNLGPCGEGAHGPFERVHIGYSFGVLPELIAATAHRVLAG